LSYFLVAIMLFVPYLIHGQSVDSSASASLRGTVRDSHDRPVADATVSLQTGTRALTAHTDAAGIYRFSALHEGTYALRAEMAGYTEVTFGPFALGQNETKQVNLTLESAKPSKAQSSPTSNLEAATPEFFDEPKFTVAGVTDAPHPGGHGSDTVFRNSESLAKATVALSKSKESTGFSPAAASGLVATEQSLREAAHAPGNFAANHQLGKLLVDTGRFHEAIPYLERASQLDPDDYGNAYELALAYADTGDYARARTNAQALLARQDKAEVHHLLGDVDERLNDPLAAVREYQRGTELDPNESNLFDWGAELLMHRALEPAIEVFTKGNHLYPRSVRMLLGLGVAWYARGSYDEATRRLFEACDLNPDDQNPYLFLGKIQSAEVAQREGIVERLERFARLQPEHALANYYYAVSLWKRRTGVGNTETSTRVESLLEKSVHLDPKLGAGYLQLGILYAERKDFPKAIVAYQKAVEVSPRLETAHYRLAQAYRQAGDSVKAERELQEFERLSKENTGEAERERHEVQQFVYTLQGRTNPAQPQ